MIQDLSDDVCLQIRIAVVMSRETALVLKNPTLLRGSDLEPKYNIAPLP